MKFRQLNETLDHIIKGKDIEEKVARTKQSFADDPTFAVFIKMAIDPAERIIGLPEGPPPLYKGEIHMPDGVSDTTARQEFRRIRNFIANGTAQALTKSRRENLWTNLLEGMHWKEAEILTHIKDQTLLDAYPDLLEILPIVGFTLINKTVEKPKKMKKSKISKELMTELIGQTDLNVTETL